MHIARAIEIVLDDVGNIGSMGTLRSYRAHAKRQIEYWGPDREVDSITRLEVQLWANQRRGKCSAASLRHEMAFMSRLFREAQDQGELLVSPISKIKLPQLNNQRNRTLSIEEESAIMQVLGKKGKKFFTLILFAIHTGMRRLEQFSLKPDDVTLWQQGEDLVGMAHVRTSKTGLGRQVPLNPVAANIARAWTKLAEVYLLGPAGKNRYEVGQSASARLRRACKEAGIRDFRWHDLRHTCASRALKNGAKLEQIQALLGHKSILQTQRYVHWTNDHVWPAVMAIAGKAA